MYRPISKLEYKTPECVVLPAFCESMLASSFNGDNNTEYIFDEDGDWL